MSGLPGSFMAAQAFSLLALALCIAAFMSKRDDRLLLLLVTANIAFCLHFMLLDSWTAAAITALIVVRSACARRFKGSWRATLLFLAASGIAAAATWQTALDLLPLTAAIFGTVGMFLLTGISMRVALAGAALAWTLNNAILGSIGGTIAEGLILTTNLVTIARLMRERALADAASG